ncbi:hypothetical protein GobsT_12250 [Gemmata obscuriglobus]|uniref:Uncharacterized protein n=1 Tax=Gemmata obscuriglobus TaxID=114 RepID=A0A2Z3H9K6_9BACT|nr:hypothetical protein [Gemmata obscuriglobus]AWM40306.1 hypothetical protein C1280_27085 [Gemmata obscuriglobus]QEG26485.1 hypothetical protein GobsT_12250 [Gemmata obscuriglobus]VTS01743.1 unnamed protein product [Gemmata obscuriglobus UQM 2246]
MATPDQQLEALTRLTAQQLGTLKLIQGAVGQINGQLKGLKAPGPKLPSAGGGGAGGGKGKGTNPLEMIGGFVGKFGKVLGVAGAVVSGVVAALTAIPMAIVGVVQASASYVGALNPSAVEQYDRAQNDLRATIGYGLQPIIAYATKSLKDWAGILLPSIQQLRPVVERISAAVSGYLIGPVRLVGKLIDGFAKGLEGVLPVIESLVSTAAAFGEVQQAITDVLAASGLGQLLGVKNDLNRELLKFTAEAFRKLVTALVIATARLLQLAGATESLKRFKDSLQGAVDARKAPKSGLTAAPSDAGTGSIEDVLKRLNERAFVATSGATTKQTDTEYLEDLVKVVGQIQANPLNWKQMITDAVRDALPPGPAALLDFVGMGDASSGGSRRGGGAAGAAGLLTRFAAGGLRGAMFGGS